MLVNNGKRIKELLEEKETTSENVNQSLSNDRHFMICKIILKLRLNGLRL